MSSAIINDIKARRKSIDSTMQITKAMELVSTSKLRRAKLRAENTRLYNSLISSAVSKIACTNEAAGTAWTEKKEGKTLFIVIAGDRGLAGGFNSAVFKLFNELSQNTDFTVLPIGKKACEHFSFEKTVSKDYGYTADVGVGEAMQIGALVTSMLLEGKISHIVLLYTDFVSMLSQQTKHEQLLPLAASENRNSDIMFDGDPEEMLLSLVPEYIGGKIYSAVCLSEAAEHAARRTAMNSANKNAEEMISELDLSLGRARQAAITQEITEIVSGANAL